MLPLIHLNLGLNASASFGNAGGQPCASCLSQLWPRHCFNVTVGVPGCKVSHTFCALEPQHEVAAGTAFVSPGLAGTARVSG